MRLLGLHIVCVIALFSGIAKATAQTASPPPAPSPKKANERPVQPHSNTAEPFDDAPIEKMSAQCVRLETEAGTIELEMLAEAAPESVRNFLNLAATGAFDTTTFSRVVKDFVVQGGNLATRTPPISNALAERMHRTIPDEPSYVKHMRGIVSMARTDTPHSATTNFFILVSDAPHLDGTFSAFGRVVAGMDVVDAINHAPIEGEKPLKPVRLLRATVVRCTKPSVILTAEPLKEPERKPEKPALR